MNTDSARKRGEGDGGRTIQTFRLYYYYGDLVSNILMSQSLELLDSVKNFITPVHISTMYNFQRFPQKSSVRHLT